MGITTYTDELAATICERIALGESLRKICDDEEMPDKRTVFRWLDENDVFCHQYARARERQAESLMDDVIEIADDKSGDAMLGAKGFEPNSVAVSRAKLQVDARLKLMGQLAPKKYGPKMAVTGADGAPLVPAADLTNLSPEDLRTMLELRRKMRPQEGQPDAS